MLGDSASMSVAKKLIHQRKESEVGPSNMRFDGSVGGQGSSGGRAGTGKVRTGGKPSRTGKGGKGGKAKRPKTHGRNTAATGDTGAGAGVASPPHGGADSQHEAEAASSARRGEGNNGNLRASLRADRKVDKSGKGENARKAGRRRQRRNKKAKAL